MWSQGLLWITRRLSVGKESWEMLATMKWVFMEVWSWFWITVSASLDVVDGIFVPCPEAEQQRRWARHDWPKSTERIPANSGISLSLGCIHCRIAGGYSKALPSCPNPRDWSWQGPPGSWDNGGLLHSPRDQSTSLKNSHVLVCSRWSEQRSKLLETRRIPSSMPSAATINQQSSECLCSPSSVYSRW